MKPIGGYFELELTKGQEYHRNALRLNTGRNAFEYVLRVKKYSKVFLPYYTCEVMVETLKKTGVRFEYYALDKSLYPILDFSGLTGGDVVVYTNYFGICDENINKISNESVNLIIDNSQAFYSLPIKELDTFYSARKFFGVPDGAYLYTNRYCEDSFAQDLSYARFEHLLGRIDAGAEIFYPSFKSNDLSLKGQDIKIMSNLTQRLLMGIDYKSASKIRQENFNVLHRALDKTNMLKFGFSKVNVPLVYPYLISNGHEVKMRLIEQKVFIPTYWPHLLETAIKESWEYFLAENLISLPVDQRYGKPEMLNILKCMEEIIGKNIMFNL
jgi:hypothetical protein